MDEPAVNEPENKRRGDKRLVSGITVLVCALIAIILDMPFWLVAIFPFLFWLWKRTPRAKPESQPQKEGKDRDCSQRVTRGQEGETVEKIRRFEKIEDDLRASWSPKPDDVSGGFEAKLSSTTAFPQEIYAHYATAKLKTACGCFPEIGRFYCICDNKLFMWPIDDSKVSEQKEEIGSVITAVGICGIDPQFFPNNKHTMTLVIATPTYIKIIPLNGGRIDFDSCYLVEIDFPALCILKGPCGRIFIGTDWGELYLVMYDGEKYCARTSWWFGRFLRRMTGVGDDAIMQLCMDPSGTVIGGIDEKHRVWLFGYNLETDKLFRLHSSVKLEGVVSLSPVLGGFMAFDVHGERIWCKVSWEGGFWWPARARVNTITIPKPNEMDENAEVRMAYTTMGLTVMMCKNSILFLRTETRCNRDTDSRILCELVTKSELGGDGLCFAFNKENYELGDCLVWEHICESPKVYVLTTGGGFSATFTLPYEELQKHVFMSKGCLLTPVSDWLNRYDLNEACANLLLCSTVHPDKSNWFIVVLARYLNRNYEWIMSRDRDVSDCFYVRVARLCSGFWKVPVFTKIEEPEEKYKVSQTFKQLPLSTLWQLQATKDIIDKYFAMKNIMIQKHEVSIMRAFKTEKEELAKLANFITFILETLKFIGYFAQQKSVVITKLFDFIKNDTKKVEEDNSFDDVISRLTEVGFCPDGESDIGKPGDIYLVDALIRLRSHFYGDIEESPELTGLSVELSVQAPKYCHISDSQMTEEDAVSCLGSLISLSPHERKLYLPTIVRALVENPTSGQDGDKEFHSITNTLCQMGYFDEMIQVLLSRGHAIDPDNLVLLWLSDMTKEDTPEIGEDKGSQLFIRVFKLYRAVFDRIDVQLLLETLEHVDDELLHVAAFSAMINQLESCMSESEKKSILISRVILSSSNPLVEKMVKDKFNLLHTIKKFDWPEGFEDLAIYGDVPDLPYSHYLAHKGRFAEANREADKEKKESNDPSVPFVSEQQTNDFLWTIFQRTHSYYD